jgi:SAM-dependent methyltransferase
MSRMEPAPMTKGFQTTPESRINESTYWESVATTRWGTYVTQVERRIILQGQSITGPPSHAMEIGCEGGRWSKMLFDLGWNMTCVDVNPVSLEICRSKIPQAECLLANPEDKTLACASGSLSLLLCIEVAPVIQSNWFVSEAARVLKENGILVGVFWNKASIRGYSVAMKNRLLKKPEPFYQYSYGPFKKNLVQNGFKILKEEGFCWAPLGRESNSPLVPAFTLAERFLHLHRLPLVSPWIAFIAKKQSLNAERH